MWNDDASLMLVDDLTVGQTPPAMDEVSWSLWLPLSRANFYSVSANGWMKDRQDGDELICRSCRLGDPDYVPLMQVSVLRRLLEVMPRSFGYGPDGRCEVSDEPDELRRPVSVTMELTINPSLADANDCPQRRANLGLLSEGVTRVRLRVNENGAYTFTVTPSPSTDPARARTALLGHVREVFGGTFSLNRLTPNRARRHDHIDEGGAAVKLYNGIEATSQKVATDPLGALSFFQLNTLVEGLCNDMLSPAVFFEQHDFMDEYLKRPEGSIAVVRTIGDLVKLLATNADSTLDGQIVALHHFLAVTSRESLQRLKWSVESVRRSLLDEMMGILHRQSRLIQLNLGASDRERTPELAEGASEAQLRGYVMLVAAKLPLVRNVYDLAQLAVLRLDKKAKASPANAQLAGDVERLHEWLVRWKVLVGGLENNVHGLERAIEHAWMEELLYEQKQVRSEQEAMAEIERSRNSRPLAERAGKAAYNAVMLILAAAAVLVTIKTADVRQLGGPGTGWWELAVALWPIGTLAVIAYLVVPAIGGYRRIKKESRGLSDSHPYEYSFRVDEQVDAAKVYRYMADSGRRDLKGKRLKKYTVTNRGGGRIERISFDTSVVKLHSVVAFRVARGKYARFEVVNEILAHKLSGRTEYVLVQCRLFGDSPRPLAPDEVLDFLTVMLDDIGGNIAADQDLGPTDLLELVQPMYADSHSTSGPPTTRRRFRRGLRVPVPRSPVDAGGQD